MGPDPTVEITCDASPWGLGGTLAVDGVLVAHFAEAISPEDVQRLGIVNGSCRHQAACEALVMAVAIRLWMPRWAPHRAAASSRSPPR